MPRLTRCRAAACKRGLDACMHALMHGSHTRKSPCQAAGNGPHRVQSLCPSPMAVGCSGVISCFFKCHSGQSRASFSVVALIEAGNLQFTIVTALHGQGGGDGCAMHRLQPLGMTHELGAGTDGRGAGAVAVA